jgi:hypothetical protein
VVVVLFGPAGRLCQAAMTGSLTQGSSPIGALGFPVAELIMVRHGGSACPPG